MSANSFEREALSGIALERPLFLSFNLGNYHEFFAATPTPSAMPRHQLVSGRLVLLHIELLYSTSDFRLVVQNHVQQGTVDFNLAAVVIDKAQFPKFVHEKTHARSRRADHIR